METNKQNEIRNAYEHSAQVQCIPASIKKTTEHSEEDPLVVAPYCRVSTDNKDQLASYELQCQYYKEYVSKHPGWRLYDIYADEGISGTSVKKRTDFLRMIDDCKAGKIDMIIVKNIARFARNVVDCVATVRMFWCKAQDAIPILRSLKGQKFLIKGNHDRCNDNKFLREFVKVTEYLEVKDSGRTVILCHYPIPCFKNHFYGSFHLYGHVHNSFEWNMMEHDKYLMEELYTTPCQMFNVGAMMPWMDYTPRTLDEIIAANSHNEAVRNK